MDSTQFVNIFCDHVLLRWNDIATTGGGTDLKLEILKIFAELTENCGEIENAQDKINIVYDVLMVISGFFLSSQINCKQFLK